MCNWRTASEPLILSFVSERPPSLWLFDPGADSPCCLLQFTGVILLAVGVWGKVSLEAYLSLASEESTNAPYVLIGTGATIVIFGLFGCFATCRGSPWMLKLVGIDAVSFLKYSLLMCPCLIVFVCFLQYAMFLTLVFLAELVAGVSGFIFRHEVTYWSKTLKKFFFKWITSAHWNTQSALFCIPQIKAKLGSAYKNAVKNYNANDTSSSAVDTIQRTVSGQFSITLTLSDIVVQTRELLFI